MKVYSRSQGKVIEQPTDGGLNVDTTDPRTMLGLIALSGANTPAEIISATNLAFPADVVNTRNETKRNEALDTAQQQVQQALSLINKPGKSSGAILFPKLRQSLGIFPKSQDRVQLEEALANIAGPQAFGEAGKALTETEKALIQGKVPEITTYEGGLRQQLLSILQTIEEQRVKSQNPNAINPDVLWNLTTGGQ